ncbi:hypothetical protein N7478_004366 [Penicillium angulare]|uniref:uncharacterized protein n=1 Tax=Penicillium angulare TaxID=116970 RepID=UPI00254013A1|nr:uncharacterized protein N7478_004366 [Penicillium angulare]KAJ5278994.1 hypothetical protein N7478_004366 [Penicillium angulare]
MYFPSGDKAHAQISSSSPTLVPGRHSTSSPVAYESNSAPITTGSLSKGSALDQLSPLTSIITLEVYLIRHRHGGEISRVGTEEYSVSGVCGGA